MVEPSTAEGFMGRPFLTALIFGLVFMIAALAGTSRWAYQQGFAEKAGESSTRLALYRSYLQGVLEKYETLPELLATDKRLVNFLQNPDGRERIEALNRYLETVNRISDAADTYLMDREGLTIAASNWQTPRPFVGRNFSFRPYFQEAMEGHLGRYFALGATSSQRGYYFAYPVRHQQQILGTLVMKINIDTVEDKWKKPGDIFLVTDPEGVIFITTKTDWRYRTLLPLSHGVLEMLVASKRYPAASLTPINIIHSKVQDDYGLVSIVDEENGVVQRYLHLRSEMREAGWEVQILSDIKGVEQFVIRTMVAVGSVFTIAVMLILLFWQRQLRLQERHRYEEKSRRMLEDANEVLESRVSSRTRELTRSNSQLRQEITERQRTEAKLRRTRKELVHAAKLAALGQMSAGITHELNQPLAAIRTYSENAVRLFRKERGEDALWNLEQISELTERMAALSTQLKLFARKTSDRLEIVPLHGSLDGALEILRPALVKSGVKLEVRIIPEDLEVWANNVLLQQVLVNLISNALHAVQNQEEKRILITAHRQGGLVKLLVQDNGPGVVQEVIEQVFEPFFTTKEPGQGLGLGLTISARIVREMGGTIEVANTELGACFTIKLKTP
ncbi:sensor histidine kinase [Desulfogranum mediterraneum]|uniref:sensor histidine kinase n=1 Tax=Desulfogranum mediterraneum TaxID=160661 RepID=UPI0004192C76|nr:ATP-binding protein [Desulfogranum mediterraneum]